jgi:hypothetical protein
MTQLGRSGQGLTEYLILLFLISIICIGTAKTLGSTVQEKLKTARRHIHEDITLE